MVTLLKNICIIVLSKSGERTGKCAAKEKPLQVRIGEDNKSLHYFVYRRKGLWQTFVQASCTDLKDGFKSDEDDHYREERH